MARANIPVNKITRQGIANATPTAGTADGIKFDNDGSTFLEVTNAAGATRSVTFVTPGQVGDRQIEDLTVSIPASATRKIGKLSTSDYNRPSSESVDPGKVYMDFQAGQEAQLSVAIYGP